jgi:anti-sigma factor RsiW
MSCDLERGKLDAYVDGECSQEELASMDAHLRTCPSCAADALGRLQMKRMTKAVTARYAPSPEFRLRIEKRIRAKGKPFWAFAWMPGFAVPAVSVAVLLIAVSVVWTRHAAREQVVAELLDLHVATLASANPVDVISTDRHTVKPWFQGKLPFTFNLPELQNSPFKLIGGKVIYFDHNPGAQLLFQLGNHHLSVFILQNRPGMMPQAVTSAREMAFSVESWCEGGLRYVVIGDVSPADIHELGELLRAAARP